MPPRAKRALRRLLIASAVLTLVLATCLAGWITGGPHSMIVNMAALLLPVAAIVALVFAGFFVSACRAARTTKSDRS
ncbi:hypothetical protein [Oleiharenicola sp. Vm1]|uniref:hypothetical protein n=1 Tax=Oleiharenicola sp. Vm1 TaxID=3398393 RepID=UPI0039F60156